MKWRIVVFRRLVLSGLALLVGIAAALIGPALAGYAADPIAGLEVEKLFAEHCASCHGEDRFGGTGPALIPETLGQKGAETVMATITGGRSQTQMKAFGDQLTADEIAALAAYVRMPLANVPEWGAAQITASRIVNPDYVAAAAPTYDADPLDLFVVVETGDNHATILDGGRFEPLTRFATRYALHGDPKLTPDGRFVFFMSGYGWVAKYDLWSLQIVAEVRAGINSCNIALSTDGRHIAVANYLPHSLVILSGDNLMVEKIIDTVGRKGRSSRVSGVYPAPPRQSFIVTLKDIPEVWEVFYGENPPFQGFVHDYRLEGPPKQTELFPVRKIGLDDFFDDFFFDHDYEHLIGASRNGKNGQVVDLVIGRKIADIDIAGLPHLGSGISWTWNGRPIMATPHLKSACPASRPERQIDHIE